MNVIEDKNQPLHSKLDEIKGTRHNRGSSWMGKAEINTNSVTNVFYYWSYLIHFKASNDAFDAASMAACLVSPMALSVIAPKRAP